MSSWGWSRLVVGVLLLVQVLLAGCGEVELAGTPPAASLEVDDDELRALKTIESVPVQPLGLSEAPLSFFVESRQDDLGQYPCSACHTEPLPPRATSLVETQQMHVNVELDHGKSGTLDCRTCHQGENLDTLRLLDGQSVAFDHSYQLCTQCHFEQATDWIGGAHGRRLGGWRGKRVVQNCTACHDPHAPAIEPRYPVTFPQLPHADEQLSWDEEEHHGN